MFAGRVDRSGGREGKKSLRKNKIAIKDMQKNQVGGGQASESKPAPPRLCTLTPESLFDCGCALANRKFENDQLKVIERAKRSHVPVMLVMTNDFEKQEELIKLTGEHSGHIYALVGIHPDNVKRMNEKLFAQRLAQLKTLAMSPPVVGLSCGLDFSRDVGSHYAQEKLLNAQLELSAALNLPAVISQTAANEKLVELVLQHAASVPAVGLFNFTATTEAEIAAWVAINDQFPIYFILTGLVTEKNDKAALFRTLIPKIPIDRLLLASDSPFYTPQNIEDVWVREQRNEPSNLPSVVQVLSEACGVAKPELLLKLRLNAKSFFGLLEAGELTDVEETEEVLKQVNEAKELEEQVQQAEAAAAKLALSEAKKDSDGGGSDEGSAGKMRKPAAAGRKSGSPQARGKPAPAAPLLKGKAARRERRQRMQDLDEDEEAAEGSEEEEEETKRGGARSNKKGQREPPRPVLAPRAKDKPAAAAAKKPAAKAEEKAPEEVDDDEEADDAEEDEAIGNIDLGYACRMCRSVLFFTDDIVPHQFGGGVEGCQVYFLKTIPAPTSSAEGKLLCTKCGAKVGRVAKTPLACSCGSLQAADSAVHVYAKKKATDLKSNQLTATEIAEFQEAKAGARKKRTEKKKGPAKKSTSNFSSFRNKDTK